MDSVTETMSRVYRLLEKHAPQLMQLPGGDERIVRPSRRVDFTVTVYAPGVRAGVEGLLRSGIPPLEAARRSGVKYNTVLRWSACMGLKWPKGRLATRRTAA